MEKGKSVGQDLISSISLSKKGKGPDSGSEVISSISLSKKSVTKNGGPEKMQGYVFGKPGEYKV